LDLPSLVEAIHPSKLKKNLESVSNSTYFKEDKTETKTSEAEIVEPTLKGVNDTDSTVSESSQSSCSDHISEDDNLSEVIEWSDEDKEVAEEAAPELPSHQK